VGEGGAGNATAVVCACALAAAAAAAASVPGGERVPGGPPDPELEVRASGVPGTSLAGPSVV
jgi:hypothetical protein